MDFADFGAAVDFWQLPANERYPFRREEALRQLSHEEQRDFWQRLIARPGAQNKPARRRVTEEDTSLVENDCTDRLGPGCPPLQAALFQSLLPERFGLEEEEALEIVYGLDIRRCSSRKLSRYRNRLRTLQHALNERFVERNLPYQITRWRAGALVLRHLNAKVKPRKTPEKIMLSPWERAELVRLIEARKDMSRKDREGLLQYLNARTQITY